MDATEEEQDAADNTNDTGTGKYTLFKVTSDKTKPLTVTVTVDGVVKGNGPSLLGLDWLNDLVLDWPPSAS